MKDIENLELRIAKFLRAGVLAASVLLALSWLSQIQFQENPFLAFRNYESASLETLIENAWSARNWGLLAGFAGLFVLISLPGLRVLLTFIIFIKEKEYPMALIAAFVLCVLLISAGLGLELH